MKISTFNDRCITKLQSMVNGKKNGVGPSDKDNQEDDQTVVPSQIQTLKGRFLSCFKSSDGEAPRSWKERLTFVADNSKDDKEAPSFLFGYIRCYLVFDKDSDSYYRWLLIVNFAVLYNLIFVIGRSCFWEMENLMPIGWIVLDYFRKSNFFIYNDFCFIFSDFLYILDIFVRIHEGYLEQGLMVKDPKLLRKNYMKGSKYIVDILSIFPTDFAYFFFNSKCHEQIPCPVIVRLNRILRFGRMAEFFDKTETRTSYPNAFRILKIILNLLILIHWDSCFYFVVSFYVGFETDVWVYHG